MTIRPGSIVDGGLVLTDRLARAIAPVLDAALDETESRGVPVDAELAAFVDAVKRNAAGFRNRNQPGGVGAPRDAHLLHDPDDQLLSTAEAADLARVSAQAIRQAAREERLVATRVGTRWTFHRRDVDLYRRCRG